MFHVDTYHVLIITISFLALHFLLFSQDKHRFDQTLFLTCRLIGQHRLGCLLVAPFGFKRFVFVDLDVRDFVRDRCHVLAVFVFVLGFFP